MKPATVLIILVLVICANAQQGKSNGVLNGEVVDVAGAPIGRASVTVRSPTTKDFRILTSDDGRFLAALPFGKYELVVTCAGFQPLERTVNIEAGRHANVELELQIGSNAYPDPMVDATPVAVPTIPSDLQGSLPTGAPERVWMWSKQCGGNRKLGVTVRLERKVLYRGVLPICRGSRDAEDGRAEFHFAGGHLFQGEYSTRSTNLIQGDIWQAGGETDALILGISFDTKKQILLNTLHIARPDTQTSSELDKGLFITTYPVPAR